MANATRPKDRRLTPAEREIAKLRMTIPWLAKRLRISEGYLRRSLRENHCSFYLAERLGALCNVCPLVFCRAALYQEAGDEQ